MEQALEHLKSKREKEANENAKVEQTNNTLSSFDKELEKNTAAEGEKSKSTAAEKSEASAQVNTNKEVEGTKVKKGDEFGNWLAHQLASHAKAKKELVKHTAAEGEKPNSTATESLRH